MKRFNLYLISFILFSLTLAAQTDSVDLETPLKKYFSSYSVPGFRPKLSIGLDHYEIDEQNKTLFIYGNEGFSSQAFTPKMTDKIYDDIKKCLPQPFCNYKLQIYGFDQEITTLIPNIYKKDQDKSRLWDKLDYEGNPWTQNVSTPVQFNKGLQNRHLTLWASHGRYYNFNTNLWSWQRPFLFCTTEDLFTQSFVVPFLIPMLENSGAVVYSPRERCWQTHEVIVDNDKDGDKAYSETVAKYPWEKAPLNGYAKVKNVYYSDENPFDDGTARCANAVRQTSNASYCHWIPNIPETGNYAVYVSYQSFQNSIDDAEYIVHHKGIATRFRVNQQMGGSTWVYLGSFDFAKGQNQDNCVSLSNVSKGSGIVSADAVRFGGGMGDIIRGDSLSGASTSGLPRYLEGARYSVQLRGCPDSTYNTKDGYNDYADDINARSKSMNYLGSGSVYIPDSGGCKVPFELSMAVHSDAGVSPDDQVIGTLAIYTQMNGAGQTLFHSGVSRMASSDLAGIVQHSVCDDLSKALNLTWTRRELYNRNYSETRWPEVPSIILETLSHQNFNDMKLGHDPNFKFLISRAIYKGILRFVANQHKTDYVVQPLPVKNFSALLQPSGKVMLSWSPTRDSLESTATPSGYIVYTRRDSSDFDNGTVVQGTTSVSLPVDDDVIYSFKVCAFNDGGQSFPSEVLSVMHSSASKNEVLIVNGFTRLSAPAIINNNEQAGFDLDNDLGVAYIQTPEYSGRQINYERATNSNAGAEGPGYSGQELQGTMIAGNSFDYPYIHGKAISSDKGFSFSSCSMGALCSDGTLLDHYKILDLIFGLQKNDGQSSMKPYKTFTPRLCKLLQNYLSRKGSNMFISGSYVASDMQQSNEKAFTSKYLHYSVGNESASSSDSTLQGNNFNFSFSHHIGDRPYAVMHPDRLAPANGAFPFLTYSDGSSGAVAFADEKTTIVTLGFPFESIHSPQQARNLMHAFLHMIVP